MKVLVAVRVPGVDVHEVIQAHRLYLMELMQQWTRLKDGEARDDLGRPWPWTPSCSGSTRLPAAGRRRRADQAGRRRFAAARPGRGAAAA